jgi:hypothetical protein
MMLDQEKVSKADWLAKFAIPQMRFIWLYDSCSTREMLEDVMYVDPDLRVEMQAFK